MATVYSEEVAVGTYNRIRIRCDYSGTSATLSVEFRRTSSWTDTWRDDTATLDFNNQSKPAAYNYSGTVGTSWVTIVSGISGYTISTSGGTYGWRFNNPQSASVLGCSGSITIPAQSTGPTGLTLSNVVSKTDGFTGTVSITSWGTGGTVAGRFKELSVCTSNNASQRKKVQIYEDTLSTTITVDNSATAHDGAEFTIQPNTRYYLTMWSSNGAYGAGNADYTPYATLAAAPTVTLGSAAETTVTLNYSTAQDGGYYSKTIEYSLDGTTWVTGATISGGSAASGSFTISGLSAGTAYNIQTRVTTTAGSNAGPTISVTTKVACAFYVSVNGQSKKTKKLYCSVNGQSKRVKKLYASVGGETKLVFEG